MTRCAKYLKRFADKEGKEFIRRFYLKYKGKTAQEINDLFYAGLRATPRRLAAAYRYINPDKSPEQFATFMETRLPSFRGSGAPAMKSLYDAYAPGKYRWRTRATSPMCIPWSCGWCTT